MITILSARDLERVSAYLDKALSPRELVDFELRLKTEPALARAVSEIEQTRALLQRAAQRRVPRSFAIRAEMLLTPLKPAFGTWSSLNLVSAAATFVLVLVFAGDIWANGLLQFGAAAPSAEEAPQALMAEEPAAEDTVLTATPTYPSPVDIGEGEIERFAEPEGLDLQAEAPFDLQIFLRDYARPLEIGLGILALFAGIAAWLHNRKTISL